MRLLIGIVLGVFLTIGAAFVIDNRNSATPTTDGSSRPAVHRKMVNWDVVDANLRAVQRHARNALTAISQKISG